MLKRFSALFISLTIILTISGCTAPKSIEDIKNTLTNTKTDFPVNAGNDTIEQAPDDVVVLNDNIADILITCGYAKKIIGKSSECTQSEIGGVKVYGSEKKPETDDIIKLNPDIVFTDTQIEYSEYKKICDSGITILRMSDAASIDKFPILYSNICKIMDGNIKGDKIGKSNAEKVINSIEQAESNNIVRGCYLYSLDGKEVVTSEMYSSEIMEVAGIQNITSENDRNGHFSKSQIIAADKQNSFPLYIFCETGLREKIMSDKDFKSTNVVNKNRVIEIPSKYITRQGKSSYEGVMFIKSMINNSSDNKGKSLAADYGVTITDGMSYTVGDQSSNVLAIQNRLTDLGYLSIKVTGYYGESTSVAVKEFQINNELDRRDGVADKKTIERLFSTSAFSNNSTGNNSSTSKEVATEKSTFEVIIN